MIDWVTCVFDCNHEPLKLIDGMVVSMDINGEIVWKVEKRITVEGSYSSTIQIKSYTDSKVWISGNPAKFLQGHNIFGSDDLTYLMGRLFDVLLKYEELSLKPTYEQYEDMQEGNYLLSRVDFNLSWHLKNKDEVISWIRSAGKSASLKYRGAGQFSGDTLYFGKSSTYWSLKCYSKGHEISARNHRLPEDLQLPELLEWADKSLRLEIVLRSRFLKKMGLNIGKNWRLETGKELLLSVIKDLQISDNMVLSDEIVTNLPVRLRATYVLWKNGEDVRLVVSRRTYYRHRKELLTYGIDISIIQNKDREDNVIPLLRYLEAMPVTVPQWAYDKKLVA